MDRCYVLAIALTTGAVVGHAQAPTARPPLPGAPAGVTAVVNVNVVPMDTERVLPQQTVLIEGGWITALGAARQVQVPAGATRIDGQGKYLIPGLGDCHVHGTFEPGPEAFRWLANGITTIRNMDYAAPNKRALEIRTKVAAGEILGPRVYTTGSWAPPTGGLFENRPLRLDSVATYIAAFQAAGYDFIKPYSESPQILDSIGAAARRLGLPIMGHVPGPLQQGTRLGTAIAAGYTSVEHLTAYVSYDGRKLYTPDFATIPALAAATKRAGIWNCVTDAMNARLVHDWLAGLFTSDTMQRQNHLAVLPFRRELIRALQDSGAGLLLGVDALGDNPTDGFYIERGFGIHEELQALVAEGLTPYQVLVAGTRNMAAMFRTLHETGTIAVGKRADLVLLRGNPLTQIRQTRQPAGVMLGGRWLARVELDQGLAGSLKERKRYYQRYAQRAYSDLLDPFSPAGRYKLAETPGKPPTRPIPSNLVAPFAQEHRKQREAVADSLGAAAVAKADTVLLPVHQRLLDVVVRQLGEIRATLPPVHQPVFDSLAHLWTEEYADQGYRAAIPGVQPRAHTIPERGRTRPERNTPHPRSK